MASVRSYFYDNWNKIPVIYRAYTDTTQLYRDYVRRIHITYPTQYIQYDGM